MLNKIFICCCLLASLFLNASILQAKAVIHKSTDGNISLENKFIKVLITPASGGRIIKFLDKRTKLNYTNSDPSFGMFSDMLWQQLPFSKGDWLNKAYSYDIINEKHRAYITLNCPGTTGSFSWITIEKTYSLQDNTGVLDVYYRYKVNENAMQSLTICPWFHNGIFVTGKKGEIYIPTNLGVKKISYNPSRPLNESFHYNIIDGWLGYSVGKLDSGIVLTMDYKPLMCFYNWQGGKGNSLEWMYRSQKIKNGESFKVHVKVTPYKGLTTISGANKDIIGSITKDKIFIYSASAKELEIKVFQKKLPSAFGSKLAGRKISILPGEVVSIPYKFNSDGNGIYLVECVVNNSKGEKLFSFEKVLKQGKVNLKYTLSEKEKRTGSNLERFGNVILNDKEKKDCYSWSDYPPVKGTRWCKPYLGGKIKLLAIADLKNGREVIEIADRMDAELKTCTFSSSGLCAWSPVWGHNGGKIEINTYLKELLKNDYDCILIGGMQFESISKENLKIIADKIRNGTGFVSVMPTKIPTEYTEIFPAQPLLQQSYKKVEKKVFKSSSFKVKTESFMTAFPLSALPELYFFPYKTSGELVITASDFPFLCTGKAGQGRTALFTWLVGRKDNTKHCGFNPYFDNAPQYPWHEYFYGMLIKAVRWASKRSPEIMLQNVTLNSGNIILEIDSKHKNNIKAKAKLTARHQSGKELFSKAVELNIEPGRNELLIKNYNKKLLSGNNFIDVQLLVQGKVADFGAGSICHKTKVKIEKIIFEDKIYKENTTLSVLVQTNGAGDIRGKLTDNYDRVICETKGKMQGENQYVIEFPLKNLYGHSAQIEVGLSLDGKLVDNSRKEVFLAPQSLINKKWNKFNVQMSWPIRSDRSFPYFLHPVRRKAMREIGINMVLQTGIPVTWGHDDKKYEITYRQGFAMSLESIARISYKCGIGFNYPSFDFRWRRDDLKKIIADYSKTADKKYLHRNPTLEAPEYRKAYEKSLGKYIDKISKWNPLVYDLCDESSYILFSRQIDFDFSPESLSLFREWLKTQYSNLDSLNKEWGKSFKSWEEVVPDTAAEARARNVFSSWSDHRTYNEKVFTDFFKHTKSIIRNVDPNAIVGMSGTQVPRAYGGYDWSKLMPVFDTLNAYSIAGLPVILRSFKKIPMMGWVGYGAPENKLSQEIWNNVFNGHYGVSIFNEVVLLNPDMSLTKSGRDLKNILLPLRKGIGKLIFNSSNYPAEIAMHYSQPSIHAAWIEQDEGKFARVRVGWLNLLGDLGISNEFVFSKAIENGELLKRKYKALILPCSMALSDLELVAINKYVNNGGVLIFDKEAGKFNRHCSKVSNNRLAKLVKSPKVLCINKLPDNYISGQKSSALRSTVKKFLDKNDFKVGNNEFQEKINGAATYFWKLGNSGKLIGIMPSKDNLASLKIDKSKFYYDIINSKKLNSNKIKLKASKPVIIAVLPYLVNGISCKADYSKNQVKVEAEIISSDGSDANGHVLRFEVYDGNGRLCELYSANKLSKNSKACHVFYPALNETKKWEIIVKDVISGKKEKLILSQRK